MNQSSLYHDQRYVRFHQFFVLNANVMVNHVDVKILAVLMRVLYIAQLWSIRLIEQCPICLNQMHQRLFNKDDAMKSMLKNFIIRYPEKIEKSLKQQLISMANCLVLVVERQNLTMYLLYCSLTGLIHQLSL